MSLLLAAVMLLADPPKKAAKADPVDLYVAGLEEGWRREVGEIRAEIAAAKRAGKARAAEEIEKKLATYLKPTIIMTDTRPRLEAGSLKAGQVGVLSGVIKAIPDEKSMVIESKGVFFVVEEAAGSAYKVGGRFESSASIVDGTKRHDSKLLPVLRRLDSSAIHKKWKARLEAILAAEVTAADAAAKAKRDAPKQDTDDVARAKLDLAKKATKPETRLRLLKEVVELYPASTSAAEAEKLLKEAEAEGKP